MAQRIGINLNLFSSREYPFIDHWKIGQFYGPYSTDFATGSMWHANLDSEEWPNHSDYDNRRWGAGLNIPASNEYTGKYVITWEGSGEVAFDAGTWAIDADLSSNYTAVSASRWHGSNSRIVVSYTGPFQSPTLYVLRTNRDGSGNFIKRIKFYRLEDEADLLAGKVFRRGWLLEQIKFNPELVRMVNWQAINSNQHVRWEYRQLPSAANYRRAWTASPAYGETTGTNQYEVASAAGMPVTMVHGEVVTCRIGATAVRVGSKTVSAITKASPGVVTCTGHGFNTGDVIVHQMSAGMTQLNLVPCTITVSDANTYSIGIDTSTFSDFTAGTAKQYISLDVGARGAYPVMFGNGTDFASEFTSTSYLTAGDYKTFSFDKYIVASSEVTGAWIFNGAGAFNGLHGMVPPELQAKLINEMVELSAELTAEDGLVRGPFDLWAHVPHRAIMSDDDEDAANWPVEFVDVILNGANGYDPLPLASDLQIEKSNEDWNFASAFQQTGYLQRRGQIRWGGAGDTNGMSTLRSLVMASDLRAAFPGETRIKYILGGKGGSPIFTTAVDGSGSKTNNDQRVYGTTDLLSDPLYTWGGRPIDHFDAYVIAAYVLTSDTFHNANIASMTAAFEAVIGDTEAEEELFQTYCDDIWGTGPDSGETLSKYLDVVSDIVERFDALGIDCKGGMYEAGWQRSITTRLLALGSNGTFTADSDIATFSSGDVTTLQVGDYFVGNGLPADIKIIDKPSSTTVQMSAASPYTGTIRLAAYSPENYFLHRVRRSRAWAQTYARFFREYEQIEGAAPPVEFIMHTYPWGHAPITMYDGEDEGGALPLSWRYLCKHNYGRRVTTLKSRIA